MKNKKPPAEPGADGCPITRMAGKTYEPKQRTSVITAIAVPYCWW
jgi:hypothetical protein